MSNIDWIDDEQRVRLAMGFIISSTEGELVELSNNIDGQTIDLVKEKDEVANILVKSKTSKDRLGKELGAEIESIKNDISGRLAPKLSSYQSVLRRARESNEDVKKWGDEFSKTPQEIIREIRKQNKKKEDLENTLLKLKTLCKMKAFELVNLYRKLEDLNKVDKSVDDAVEIINKAEEKGVSRDDLINYDLNSIISLFR